MILSDRHAEKCCSLNSGEAFEHHPYSRARDLSWFTRADSGCEVAAHKPTDPLLIKPTPNNTQIFCNLQATV